MSTSNETGNRKPPDDGGAAFPRPLPRGEFSPDRAAEIVRECQGMTLRQYFATAAMQSIFTGPGARMVADRDERYDETNWAEVVASNAYAMADAMIAAGKGAK